MSGIGGWLGTGTAVITAGLCWLLMRYMHHLPARSHPWLHRAVIGAMYCAGAVLVVTPAGGWVLRVLGWGDAVTGGTQPGSGIGWALVTVGGLALIAALAVALIWVPDPSAGYVALGAPLILALAPYASVAHQVYAVTAGPAQELVTRIAVWAGG